MFTHLHTHSHYSLLDGLAKIDELLDAAQKNKMDALGLTDHGVMYGVIEFYQKAREVGIKPLIGVEVYLAANRMEDKRPNIDNKQYHLLLIAKNKTGYQNLIKLTTWAHLAGFYYKPRIDHALLQKHKEGLIACSACLKGEVPLSILQGNLRKAEKTALFYQNLFGPGNFYLELQHHPNLPEQAKANEALIKIAHKHNIPLIATNDIHYINPADAEAQEILLCLQSKNTLEDKNRALSMIGEDFSFRSPKVMEEAFYNIPEALENTEKIAKVCNLTLELGKTKLPHFPLPPNTTPIAYLKELCLNGLKKRYSKSYSELPLKIKERLEYELSVISKTGFATYFLIVQDFVSWAKRNNIVVGPGRGCFLPDTKILLKDGRQKNIEDIKPGERVITHLRNKRKVKKVLHYNINEEIAVIKSKMPPFELKLTKDHKVLATKHKMCPVRGIKETICKPTCNRSCRKKLWRNYKLQWIKAQDLKKNDFLVYPIPKRRRLNIKFDLLKLNNLDTRLKGDNEYVWYEIGTNKIIPKKIKRFIKLDKKLARLFGFYIAEGCSRTRRRYRECTIGFGFNKNEKENIEEVKKLLKEIFGLESSIKYHQTRNSCQVFAYSQIVARFLKRLCGQYAINKHIPYQIFESDDEIIISLLTSLLKGDGSNKDTMRVKFDSISFDLVSQVKMLLAQLGIMSSINTRRSEKKNWHQSYKLTISGRQLFQFNKLFPDFQIPIKKQKFYRNDTFIQQNYIWFPIKEVFLEKYKGKVYDLTVEKDASYITNEVAVHNSAAGSLVSYLLDITDIDPIRYDLLFERFLNPERISMPDIDLDFADMRRDEVIDYVRGKYGSQHVAQIITFGTMAARAAVRDVGRVLGYPYSFCDQIAKMIPMFFSLNKALASIPELKEAYQKDEKVKKLIDTAKKLEGVARHASTHACGVVITEEPIDEVVPRQFASASDKTIVSQYEMHAIESIGLLKMDFLGLKNLTIIENTIKIVEKIRGEKIDLKKIPLDDPKTFELLAQAKSTGIFQLESSGMKRYLKELKPTEFEDIIAMVALYRPGPIEWIPQYIQGKHGGREVIYLHPKLEPILRKTYGVAVYQEQVLQIARDLAGFSLGEADILRKAVGKKIPKLLAEQKEKFISGCMENNISRTLAEKIFSFIEPFAGYGFNRAHAACYALIGYQTAYLKAHYPAEFMAALLTSDQGNLDRIAIEIQECSSLGIPVLPPDINESFPGFAVRKDAKNKEAIRFGLSAIKNVGANLIKAVIAERKTNGTYQSLDDFLKRIKCKDLNKKSLESLVKCGALDRLGERKQMLANLDRLLRYAREQQKMHSAGQRDLFGHLSQNGGQAPTMQLEKVAQASEDEKLKWEKELLGLYISYHPLENYRQYLAYKTTSLAHLSPPQKNGPVTLGGIITAIKKIITRKGDSMLFVTLEDLTGKIEILVFSNLLAQTPALWQEDKVILVTGKISDKEGELKLLADSAEEVTAASLAHFQEEVQKGKIHPESVFVQKESCPIIQIKLPGKTDRDFLLKLKQTLVAHPGSCPVYLTVPNGNPANTDKIKTEYKIAYDENIAQELKNFLGEGNIRIS